MFLVWAYIMLVLFPERELAGRLVCPFFGHFMPLMSKYLVTFAAIGVATVPDNDVRAATGFLLL